MRIAILMGITYAKNQNLDTLPACVNDLNIIDKIIEATNLYDEKLVLDDNYPTAYSAIEKITSFVEEIEKKNTSIDEVFVYYSGHGGFQNNEFYYAWNDYSNTNPNTTSLLNSQFDDLLRRMKSKLTVKFIDACQSGLPYIKDINHPTFQDCFFCFSCHKNQSSMCDDKNSFFTYSFVEAIKDCLKNSQIRYRDIQNSIADKFNTEKEDDSGQKPYFCTQGKNTDIFCTVSEELKGVINNFFLPIEAPNFDDNIDDKIIEKPIVDYLDVIEKLDSYYLKKEEIKSLTANILNTVKSIELDENLNRIKFTRLITTDKINKKIPCYKSLCRFVDNNCADYFIDVTYDHETRTVKKEKRNPWDLQIGLSSIWNILGSYEPTYEWVEEPVSIPKDFNIRNDLGYDYISFKIKSNCKCITDKELILIPFYNNTSIYLVHAQFDYKYTGLEETGPIQTTWKGKTFGQNEIINVIKDMIIKFQEETYKNIKEFLDKEREK